MDGSSPPSEKPTLLERLSALLAPEPEDRDELVALLRAAHERELLDAEALAIIEGTLQMPDMRVRDIMVPRARMGVVHIEKSIQAIAEFAVKTGHSRFPVIDGDKDDVLGILLAKDLLRHFAGQPFELRQMLRPAIFVPESEPLNVLLKEFLLNHKHMAIVVDEYGGVAGLVTIEDVLEQIVGEIEDEFDADEHSDNIRADSDGSYHVKGVTAIEDFNEAFGTTLAIDDVDTIGGYLIYRLGRLPRRGETVILDNLNLVAHRVDGRRIYTVRVKRQKPESLFQ